MVCWFFCCFAHGAAICCLCRLGWHALGHWLVRRAVACCGGRVVGRLHPVVDWTFCTHLCSHQRVPCWHGPTWQCPLGGIGHLVGSACRNFAIAHGLAALWLAAQPHQFAGHDGFYASRRLAGHGVAIARHFWLATRRQHSSPRFGVWTGQFGRAVCSQKMVAQMA